MFRRSKQIHGATHIGRKIETPTHGREVRQGRIAFIEGFAGNSGPVGFKVQKTRIFPLARRDLTSESLIEELSLVQRYLRVALDTGKRRFDRMTNR